MIAVVICAAGLSSRMGGEKKEYRKLCDSEESLTVLGASVAAFCKVSSINTIVIAISKDTEKDVRSVLPKECLVSLKPKILFVDGGQTRQASVFNALSFLAEYNPHYVLIHDGARPWVSSSLIEDTIKAVYLYGAVIPALAFSDTPKECTAPIKNEAPPEGAVFIARHLKRANMVIAQTPQAFKFPEILKAHEKAANIENEEFTDDAEIWGRFCGDVAVILGSPENRKITFPGDI